MFLITNIMLKRMVKFAPWSLAIMPFLAFAQGGLLSGNPTAVRQVLYAIMSIANWAVLLIIALTIVWFLIGLFNFMRKEGEERAKAKTDMLWGVIIIAVMVSVWGLVEWVQDIFGVDSGADWQSPDIPTI